jgi:hypothetical protein
VVDKWIKRILLAQERYQIDDPKRFYGFGNYETQVSSSLKKMNDCIDTINRFEFIIERKLQKIDDQDTLNYLHHIFEVYHGVLDQQTHEFWQRSPKHVHQALADLNVLVHRCESVARGADPRQVITYYGLPKTEMLDDEDYKLFESDINFGTVYLNYVEIGKTLEDLAMDNDQYIGDDAFRPFRHYSADFNVKFYTNTSRQVDQHHAKIKEYYNKNSEFFVSKGMEWNHLYLTPGSIPLADIDEPDIGKDFYRDHILTMLDSNQIVTAVNLI